MHLINCTPSALVQNEIASKVLFVKKPKFEHLWIFYCLYFAYNKKKFKGNKFAPRSQKCAFIGYPNSIQGWKLDGLQTGEVFVSCDVKFYYNEFSFKDGQSVTHNDNLLGSFDNIGVDIDFVDYLKSILNEEFVGEAICTTQRGNEKYTLVMPINSIMDPTPTRSHLMVVSTQPMKYL